MAHGSTNRKTYWMVFGALFILTVLEVAVAHPALGVPKIPLGIALIGMALVKAALVGWFFMHLNHEMPALKYTVVLPFFFPALYAFVLIAEAGWRMLW
jgi:caa(3)-type oxidase subunit IV